MGFMEPDIRKETYYEVDTTHGTQIIPVDVCGTAPGKSKFKDYIDPGSEVVTYRRRTGWLYRLNAPGYMDCTNWGAASSYREAIAELLDLYGDDSSEDWVLELDAELKRLNKYKAYRDRKRKERFNDLRRSGQSLQGSGSGEGVADNQPETSLLERPE